ncbi:MAG: hypothetical protein JKY95_20160, partial [Planctomycetaceae bacterium]|nr:hypothetical protein [Planctomycetaceae bacterium]
IAMGGWLYYALRHTNRRVCLNGFGVGAIVLVVAGLSVVAPWISQAQESFRLADHARKISDADAPLATFDYFSPNLPFYARRQITRFHSPEEIEDYFREHPQGLLCVREDHQDRIAEVLPDQFQVVLRTRRFFRTHDVLLIQGGTPPIQSATLPQKSTLHK